MWLPPVPAFVVRMMLGEMASVVLDGSRVRPDKMTRLGFRFRHPDAETALREIYGKNG
jgi:NAD dependent epimerase/dehydratase family enzyme